MHTHTVVDNILGALPQNEVKLALCQRFRVKSGAFCPWAPLVSHAIELHHHLKTVNSLHVMSHKQRGQKEVNFPLLWCTASPPCSTGVFEELRASLDQQEPRTGSGSKDCSDFHTVLWRGKEKCAFLPQLKGGWEKTALSFPKRTYLQHFHLNPNTIWGLGFSSKLALSP